MMAIIIVRLMMSKVYKCVDVGYIVMHEVANVYNMYICCNFVTCGFPVNIMIYCAMT